MENFSDSELLHKIKEGNEDALRVLLTRHYDTVFHFAFKYCLSIEDAEDVAQETLMKITRGIMDFRLNPNVKFTTFLFRVTANTAKDHHKKNNTRIKYEKKFASEMISENSHHGGNQDDILQALKKLPPKQYEAVNLVYSQGFSHSEAADIMGVAVTTVSWRIFMAKKMLKKTLREYNIVLLFIMWMSPDG